MNIEEAKTVAKICYTADGGCFYCARLLLEKLQVKFPDFIWSNLLTEEEKEKAQNEY